MRCDAPCHDCSSAIRAETRLGDRTEMWLIGEGWSGKENIFLDLDPERGIAAGQRWARALEDARRWPISKR